MIQDVLFNENEIKLQTGFGKNHNDEKLFYIINENVSTSKKYDLLKKDYAIKIKTPDQNLNIVEYLENAIQQFYEFITQNITENSKVGIIFHSDAFMHGPGILSYRYLKNISVNDIWDLFFKISQSRDVFKIDDSFNIKVCSVDIPHGKGRKKITRKTTLKKDNKRCIVQIQSKDNFCFPRAIVTAIAERKYKNDKNQKNYNAYKRIIAAQGSQQLQLAEDLCKKANVKISEKGVVLMR